MAENPVGVSGLSHVSCYVSDLERSKRFYREVFGFASVFEDEIGGAGLEAVSGVAGAAGRVCGGRIGDLRLELMQLNIVPAKPRPPGLGLSVLSIQVADADAAYAAAQRLGVKCRCEPVGLYGTRMFFVVDPDGQAIEMVEYPRGSPAWGGEFAAGS